jgi:hypothetical protein
MTPSRQYLDISKHWPRPETGLPSPWCLPLTMVATGRIVAVELVDRASQLFRYQNWSAQIEIPLYIPDWLEQNFPGILDKTLHNGALYLDVFRFHPGSMLTTDDWVDQWFNIVCEPHFNYLPCALSTDDEIVHKRLAWLHDDALQP